MKRPILYALCLALGISLALGGCNRNGKKIASEPLQAEFKKAPKWVLSGDKDEDFSAVGSAHIGKGGLQFARTEAMALGRGELARQVAVQVDSLVNSFSEQTGIGSEQTMDTFSRQVSKLVTDEVLNGSRQKDIWISPGSDVYVLMILDKKMLKASLKRQMIAGYRQNESDWRKFQDRNGDRELEKEIEKALGN